MPYIPWSTPLHTSTGPRTLPALFTVSLGVTAVAAPLVTAYIVNPTSSSRCVYECSTDAAHGVYVTAVQLGYVQEPVVGTPMSCHRYGLLGLSHGPTGLKRVRTWKPDAGV